MPKLEEISYSRDATITAFREYYTFLAKMYLPEENIIHPPASGWPSITGADEDITNGLGKTAEVMTLLAKLPYLRDEGGDIIRSNAAPECFFTDWQSAFQRIAQGKLGADELKAISEDLGSYEPAPSPVFGLAAGADNPLFVLDTNLGIVHWLDCPSEIKDNPSIKPVYSENGPMEDKYQEGDWRRWEPAWAVTDFFELLKEQFRQLRFIPISPYTVTDVFIKRGPQSEGMIPMLQEIYKDHGWPNLENYRKQQCLEAVHRALEQRYPDETDFRCNR